MENSQKNLAPIEPMNDVSLDQVSGGNPLEGYQQGVGIYSTVSNTVNALLAPFADDLKNFEDSERYRKVIETLRTYKPQEGITINKCNHLANSWNNKHPGQYMSPDLAGLILGIKDEKVQAAIICLPRIDAMQQVLEQL